MLTVIIWTIVLIVDINSYTRFDLVIRDICIIFLGISLLILK